MRFSIDPAASDPPFEQVRRQVTDAVRSGELVPGARMPTVRALAAELDLAVNTVAKAYRALESDHIIETRGRAGSFVSATGDPTEQQAQLAASAYADRIARLGLSPEVGLTIVRAALRADG
ncbi:GntR family transcriptional regulator [Agromyces sp. NPDC058484]|uniref:GntR family transcriptional regulator n=1 Tax=Agromyces sp. NPDC058484 TaxID=3346524 RepID=UPI0036515873